MVVLLKLLLMSTVVFVACEDPPPVIPVKCRMTIEMLNLQCCLFPSFFTRDVARACGAKFQILGLDRTKTFNVRRISPEGNYWDCILKKYDIMDPDGLLDLDRYYAHLDKWVELNSLFSTVIQDAKVVCKQNYIMDLPLKTRDFGALHGCIRNYVTMHCPMDMTTEPCKEKKEFLDECAEYHV